MKEKEKEAMTTVKDLVRLQEDWEAAVVLGGDKLIKIDNIYYVGYLIQIPVKSNHDIMDSFKHNADMTRVAMENSKIKGVERFKKEIIEHYEKKYCKDIKIPRCLDYDSRIHINNCICTSSGDGKKANIFTYIVLEHCKDTDYSEVERLRKAGKIKE